MWRPTRQVKRSSTEDCQPPFQKNVLLALISIGFSNSCTSLHIYWQNLSSRLQQQRKPIKHHCSFVISRVIGSLSNFNKFAKAFNCPIGSGMNPLKKCSVWWWSISFQLQCYLFTTDIKGTNRTRCPCLDLGTVWDSVCLGPQKGSVILTCLYCREVYYINARGKGIQDIPGSWIPCRGFRILDTGFRIIYQWNLDSGFFELYSGFQSPGFLIFQAKIFPIRKPGFPYMGQIIHIFFYIRMLFLRSRMNILFFCRF